MPPRPSRRILLPPTVVGVALAALAACADPTTPGGADRSAALTPGRPSFASFGTSGNAFTESFDFADAKTSLAIASPYENCGFGTRDNWACLDPRRWPADSFDVAIHMRDRAAWDAPIPFRGMHGTKCQPYQTPDFIDASNTLGYINPSSPVANAVWPDEVGTHVISTIDDMNYLCRNHMMTALKAPGYGAIFVTPNALLNLNGTTTIRFNLATLRTSKDDWIDIWVTPWEHSAKLPLDESLSSVSRVDLQGPPRHAIHVRMTGAPGATTFKASVVDGYVERDLPLATTQPYDAILTQNSTFRETFELQISRSQLRFALRARNANTPVAGAPSHGELVWVETAINPILPESFASSVVQFGHHSMAQEAGATATLGGTWHWDTFSISPATPFSIIKSRNVEEASLPNGRYADAKHPDMRLASALPATGNRYLSFAAFGESVRVSFGNGQWIDAVPHRLQPVNEGRFQSYFVQIPATVGSAPIVSFKAKKDKTALDATNEDDGAWRVRDVAVWVR